MLRSGQKSLSLGEDGWELPGWRKSPGTHWYAIQVRARQELSVSESLQGKGYELFLPVMKRQKKWSDRIKEYSEPLFPGYTFCRFNPATRLPILTTPGVVQIVGSSCGPVPVDEVEIEALQRLDESGLQNQPCPFMEVGDKVRIESGPLRGLEGIFVSAKGVSRLVLSVTLLRRSIAVEIDSYMVIRLGQRDLEQSAVEDSKEVEVASGF